ncbi:MAG TPA: glycine oxidase ThiO [Blastocatellia bacterium]|nr:glycine oxidase ThiO [Blastocatellia bacterium]
MSQSIEQADVAIVGGGVIGCAIAWRLAQAGMCVVVIERGEPGREASHAAGGMLVPLAEADFADDFFNLAVASRAMYADFASELREATGIDVEYRTEGTLYLALSGTDEEELDHRLSWQRAAGFNVKRLDAGCVRKLEPLLNEKLRWALKFPDDHQVDNRRLMLAVITAARDAGAQFQTNTEARHLIIESQAGERHVAGVETTTGEVRARTVVIAAGSWSSLLTDQSGKQIADFQIEPVRGQMVAIENPAPSLRHIVYSRRGYVVPRLGGFVIAGSTSENAGYDKSVTAGGLASIIERAVEIMPILEQQRVIETWAGLRPHAPDDLPVLGADPELAGLVYATGHYRNGILLTPVTAQAISELIRTGESKTNLSPFSITRFASRSVAG